MYFIKLPAVMAKTGLGKSSIYAMMAENRFPKNIKLGPRAVAWSSQLIDEWMAERIQSSL
ncbi:AlpA family transcriptional regulator [Colwellia sp. PAMC 21821]|uniref:AlpA family transcriptional regulator n=1 Tax=Colwellia sp. PAMC 21821 TaxID=1816219 RepID=UPI0009BD376C|nr:AlpA family transcriptional regulator [Colwellia sp. PAMC 21821]ARD43523.1 transcriptional regulator [Colwellia sp. PAMC 21821]